MMLLKMTMIAALMKKKEVTRMLKKMQKVGKWEARSLAQVTP